MNRDDIIRMAREADLICESRPVTAWMESTDLTPYLTRFAALVAAAERNKLAAWMIQFGFATGHGDTMEQLVDALGSEIVDRIELEIDVAVAAEREACAKEAEDSDHVVLGRGYHDQLGDADATARNIAAAIRAREQA